MEILALFSKKHSFESCKGQQCKDPKCNQKQTSQNHFATQYIIVSDLAISIKLDNFAVGDELNEGSFNIRSYCDSCVNGVQLHRPCAAGVLIARPGMLTRLGD